MMHCRDIAAAATPLRPRPQQLARRRPAPSFKAAARRRTASVGTGGDCNCGIQDSSDATGEAAANNQLKAFAAAMTKPVTCQETQRSFDLLRALMPHRFAELCKVHLSFLIDVPADFLDADSEEASSGSGNRGHRQLSQTPGKWLRQHVRSSMKIKLQAGRGSDVNVQSELPQPTTLVPSDLAIVDCLMSLLEDHAASAEGLFRKCGSASRQRRLLDDLQAGVAPAAAAAGCSPHDIAGALKSSLAALSEPLLTDRLLPYFQQVGRLGAPLADDTTAFTTAAAAVACAATQLVDAADAAEGRAAILAARRLKGFRLLAQLLPADRRLLLGRLLALLAVTGASRDTRMTPDTLGTVFGPALLYPRHEAGDARFLAATLNSAVAFIIRQADSIMLIPDSIAKDAEQILRRMRRSPAAFGSSSASASAVATAASGALEESLSLSVRFAQAAERRRGDFTRAQVAALYAAVQAMPDSAKRRRLIRRFNRTNGGLPVAATSSANAVVSSPSPVSPSASSSTSPPSLQSPQSPLQSPSQSPLISSPVFGRMFDFPMRCLSPNTEMMASEY